MATSTVALRNVPGGFAYRGPIAAGDTLTVLVEAGTDSRTAMSVAVKAPNGLTITPTVSLSRPSEVADGTADFYDWPKGPVSGKQVMDSFGGRLIAFRFVADGTGTGKVELIV